MTTTKTKPHTMQAVVATRYGGPEVLKVQQVAMPQPKEDEVLVKVRATAATTADSMMRQANPGISRLFLGFWKPKHPIVGTGFSGVVEAVGEQVTRFQIGDEVLGETTVSFGANAEYVCLPADGVMVRKPDNVSFAEAAPLCDGPLTSWNFLKEIAQVQPGQKVMVNGASGALGTAAVQIAKFLGAEVTGVCSAKNVEFVKSLGADHVIDYTQEDPTQSVERYDTVYDTIGKISFSKVKRILTAKGVYLSPKLGFLLLLQMLWTTRSAGKKAKFAATGLSPEPKLKSMLSEVCELIAEGHLQVPVDRIYALEKAEEAYRYVDTGHKRGNVVLGLGGSLIST